MKMTKKKVTILVICLIVIAIVIGFIAYRNRTISGDYISEMLKDNNVTRITVTDRNNVAVDLQSEQFDEFYDLFEKSKFNIIYSNTYTISNTKRFIIDCSLENGHYIANFRFVGDVVNVLIVNQEDGAHKEEVTYRIKNVNWPYELGVLING